SCHTAADIERSRRLPPVLWPTRLMMGLKARLGRERGHRRKIAPHCVPPVSADPEDCDRIKRLEGVLLRNSPTAPAVVQGSAQQQQTGATIACFSDVRSRVKVQHSRKKLRHS